VLSSEATPVEGEDSILGGLFVTGVIDIKIALDHAWGPDSSNLMFASKGPRLDRKRDLVHPLS
jgi:hypothetical protein